MLAKKDGEFAAIIALKCETDFVAKNEDFVALTQAILDAAELAEQLMEMFEKGEVDRVELIYNHFKSTAVQVMTDEQYLPVEMPEEPQQTPDQYRPDYIVEPSAAEVVQTLVPQVLSLKIFTILLDSSAAEHAARTIAMQMATDNATALLQELKIQYNKSRQQAITNELLDMMGGETAAN